WKRFHKSFFARAWLQRCRSAASFRGGFSRGGIRVELFAGLSVGNQDRSQPPSGRGKPGTAEPGRTKTIYESRQGRPRLGSVIVENSVPIKSGCHEKS